jgi:hypothetical protein
LLHHVDWSKDTEVSEEGAAFFRLNQSQKSSVIDPEAEGTKFHRNVRKHQSTQLKHQSTQTPVDTTQTPVETTQTPVDTTQTPKRIKYSEIPSDI